MARPQLRVLVDLSMALHGYCGIAQDVRLLYKTLAACPDIEVTGLVYHSQRFARLHRFCSSKSTHGERLANQASFLWALSEGPFVWPVWRPLKLMRMAQQAAAAVTKYRARLEPLENEMLWPVIWRLLFSQTLAADDIPLVQNGRFLLANIAAGMIYARGMLKQRPIKLDTRGYDFLIVQGSRPFRVSKGTRQIVRYHDMIPLLHPDSRPHSRDITWHQRAIELHHDDAYFVCNSEPTRQDLTAVYPKLTERSRTIPCVLADIYRPDSNPGLVPSIIDSRRSTATGERPRGQLKRTPRYIMSVATLEPRKNFIGLIQAFNAIRLRNSNEKLKDLKLMIVGSPGWRFQPTLDAMRELVRRGDVIHLEHVLPHELRALYTHAEALVFPSHAEGFGLPPVEAMLCDTPVIVSDIPAHRWVLGDAALYCNSHDVDSIASAIEQLLASDESARLRDDLIARGRNQIKRYLPDSCSGQWLELLHELKPGSAASRPPATLRLTMPDRLENVA